MLKLPKLPDRTPVKLTVTLNPELHQRLQSYAALYRDTYGSPEPVADLVPYMLVAFLDSDRAYSKARKKNLRKVDATPRPQGRRASSGASVNLAEKSGP